MPMTDEKKLFFKDADDSEYEIFIEPSYAGDYRIRLVKQDD
jgi:hypothetical protein